MYNVAPVWIMESPYIQTSAPIFIFIQMYIILIV